MGALVQFSHGDCVLPEQRKAAVADALVEIEKQEPDSIRYKLYKLQAACGELPSVDFPLQHVFAPGVYARTIQLPAGSIILGKIHKHKHLNILSQGKVQVLTEEGGVEELEGPLTLVSPAGTKRAVVALTDAVWTTIHLTESTDLGEIEEETIARTYEEYDIFAAQQDYQRVLAETGISHKKLVQISENILDQIPFTSGHEHLEVKDSPYSGKGVFTKVKIKAGDAIGIARFNGKRTPLGRYVNHSNKPNAVYVEMEDGNLGTVAIRDIEEGKEILYDYRQGATLNGIMLNKLEVEKTRSMT